MEILMNLLTPNPIGCECGCGGRHYRKSLPPDEMARKRVKHARAHHYGCKCTLCKEYTEREEARRAQLDAEREAKIAEEKAKHTELEWQLMQELDTTKQVVAELKLLLSKCECGNTSALKLVAGLALAMSTRRHCRACGEAYP